MHIDRYHSKLPDSSLVRLSTPMLLFGSSA
jgi:hypothetical protein